MFRSGLLPIHQFHVRFLRWSQLIDATLYYSLSRERSVDYEAKNTDKLFTVPTSADVGSLATWRLTEVDRPVI